VTYNKLYAKVIALPSEAHGGMLPWLSYFLPSESAHNELIREIFEVQNNQGFDIIHEWEDKSN
jgi:hypothetical protein